MNLKKIIVLLSIVFQIASASAKDESDDSDFNYAETRHRFAAGPQATYGSTIGAQASLRLFRSWTVSVKGLGGGDGSHGGKTTNKTNPAVPHDYTYEVSRRPIWQASVTKDFWLAHSRRFTWFAGGGIGETEYQARYDFYNMSGWSRIDAGTSRDSETRTVLSAIGGFRYVELQTGFFPLPITASAQVEFPVYGSPRSSSVRGPEGQKVEEKYDNELAMFGNVALFVGVLF